MKKSKLLLAWALALTMLSTNVHYVRATETTTDAADSVAALAVESPGNADTQVSAGNVGDDHMSVDNVSDGDPSVLETYANATDTLAAEVSEGIAETVVVKQKTDLSRYFEGACKKFTVDNKKMAAVSTKGILTAKQPGTVRVTGYEKNGKVWEAKETVSILIEKPLITEKTVICTRSELTIDGSANLTGAENKPTIWLSSKPTVATIDTETGLITTVGKGSTKIVAVYGEGKMSAQYIFTVKVVCPAMSKKTAKLVTGATLLLKLKNTKLVPEWTSSDPKVASVEAGKVTVHAVGTATITATVEEMGYTCVITVTEPTLSKNVVILKSAGKMAKLAWKNTKLKGDSITWSSGDPTVATVDSTGKITAIAAGTTNITSTVGGTTGVCVVTVKGTGNSQGSEGKETDNSKAMLEKINKWYIGDIWNNLVNFQAYRASGLDCTGSEIDIDFAYNRFKKAYELKDEYNTYIQNLGDEYAELKDVWGKMNEQVEKIYNDLEDNGLKEGTPNFSLDLLRQYSDAFWDLVP